MLTPRRVATIGIGVILASSAGAAIASASVHHSTASECRYTATQVRDELSETLRQENDALAIGRTTDDRAALKRAIQQLSTGCR